MLPVNDFSISFFISCQIDPESETGRSAEVRGPAFVPVTEREQMIHYPGVVEPAGDRISVGGQLAPFDVGIYGNEHRTERRGIIPDSIRHLAYESFVAEITHISSRAVEIGRKEACGLSFQQKGSCSDRTGVVDQSRPVDLVAVFRGIVLTPCRTLHEVTFGLMVPHEIVELFIVYVLYKCHLKAPDFETVLNTEREQTQIAYIEQLYQQDVDLYRGKLLILCKHARQTDQKGRGLFG